MLRKTAIVLGLAMALLATPASAANINFLDSFWRPDSPQTFTRSLSYLGAEWAGVTLTVTSVPTNIYWDNTDGYGVTGGINDQIDHQEALVFTFNRPVLLQSVGITDLFHRSHDHPYIEKGYYTVDLGAPQLFEAVPGQVVGSTNGVANPDLGGQQGTTLTFTAFNPKSQVPHEHHDYSVSSINATLIAQTPEPATLLLFGSALFGGAFFRRRRHA